MLRNPPHEKEDTLVVDGVPVNFTPEHKMVSTHTFDALLESHEDSWETMAPSRTLKVSAAKAIFLLTSGLSFHSRTALQDGVKCPP